MIFQLKFQVTCCNCGIKAENNFLLESLAACHDANLIMYFTVNTAFVYYLDQFNLTETLTYPTLTNKTTSNTLWQHSLMTQDLMRLYHQPLRHSRNISHNINRIKEIFDLKKRHDTMDIEPPNKKFFTNNLIVDIFVFTTAIISVIATIIILYLLCKHNKLRMLVASLAL